LTADDVRYVFIHQDVEVDDPALDTTGRYFVSPREYGFTIRGFQGGKTAWARDFGNGTMLVVNTEGTSHALSPKVPARILFIADDGTLLQDSGAVHRVAARVPDLTAVRMTVNVTFDLNGESPEAARALLIRMLDRALHAGPRPGESEVTVVEHLFEATTVVGGDRHRGTDSSFSQLLDI
jgi:hypothetical protein